MDKIKLSENGILHLIELEGGTRLSLYNDLGKNKGHCTIAVGHLVHKGICNGSVPSEKPYLKSISLTKAKQILKNDLIITESAINGSVTSALNQNQYDALVSFVFNIGPTQFKLSTLLKYINQKEFKKASDEFSNWNKSTENGVKSIMDGLTNRRLAEKTLFDRITK